MLCVEAKAEDTEATLYMAYELICGDVRKEEEDHSGFVHTSI